MTIQSYLVYPEIGRGAAVAESIRRLAGCSDLIPAEKNEVFVLVTETDTKDEQNALEANLESVDGVACLAMVGGWTE